MTAWTTIDTNSLLPGEPWTSAKANAVYQNPTAIAEGSSGAPDIEVAWHFLEYKQLTGGDSSALTMDTDISAYRAVRLVGGATYAATGAVDFDVRLNISGQKTVTSTTIATVSPNFVSVMFDTVIWNIDGADSYDYKLGRTTVANFATGSGVSWDDSSQSEAAATYMGLARFSAAATGIQIYNGGTVDFNNGDAHAMLYGVKRTLA